MLCNNCAYQFDRKNCDVPDFGEIVECSGYVSKANKNVLHRKGYVIPYNFSLNTRKGFNAIHYLMKLTQYDMVSVIMIIIKARHKGIDVIINACNKIEKENNEILNFICGEVK